MDLSQCIINRTITLKTKPNSKKTEITSIDDSGLIHLSVAAPPEDNKANLEVLKFFSRLLKKKVEIIKGVISRTKVLRVRNDEGD